MALITFPQPRDSQSVAVQLETVELRDGELLVAGAMTRGHRDQLVDGETEPAAGEPIDASQPLVGAASKETRQE